MISPLNFDLIYKKQCETLDYCSCAFKKKNLSNKIKVMKSPECEAKEASKEMMALAAYGCHVRRRKYSKGSKRLFFLSPERILLFFVCAKIEKKVIRISVSNKKQWTQKLTCISIHENKSIF